MRAEEKEGRGEKGKESRAESEDAEVIKRRIFLLFCKSRRPRAAFPSKVHPIYDGGGGRTLSIVSVFRKKDISQTWIRMEESVEQHRGWIYCKRRKEKNKDRFFFFFVVLFGREAASELLEFCWVAAVSEEKRRRPRTQKNLGKRQKASRRS